MQTLNKLVHQSLKILIWISELFRSSEDKEKHQSTESKDFCLSTKKGVFNLPWNITFSQKNPWSFTRTCTSSFRFCYTRVLSKKHHLVLNLHLYPHDDVAFYDFLFNSKDHIGFEGGWAIFRALNRSRQKRWWSSTNGQKLPVLLSAVENSDGVM